MYQIGWLLLIVAGSVVMMGEARWMTTVTKSGTVADLASIYDRATRHHPADNKRRHHPRMQTNGGMTTTSATPTSFANSSLPSSTLSSVFGNQDEGGHQIGHHSSNKHHDQSVELQSQQTSSRPHIG